MSPRHLVFHNFWLKIFSVAAGIVIWMAIHFSIEHDFTLDEPGPGQVLNKETIRVPITMVEQPGDTRQFKITPLEAVLTVIGPATVLHGPERRDIKIFVDLTDFSTNAAALEDLHPDVPHEVNVIDCQPRSVNVQVVNP